MEPSSPELEKIIKKGIFAYQDSPHPNKMFETDPDFQKDEVDELVSKINTLQHKI